MNLFPFYFFPFPFFRFSSIEGLVRGGLRGEAMRFQFVTGQRMVRSRLRVECTGMNLGLRFVRIFFSCFTVAVPGVASLPFLVATRNNRRGTLEGLEGVFLWQVFLACS